MLMQKPQVQINISRAQEQFHGKTYSRLAGMPTWAVRAMEPRNLINARAL